ncbi:DUF3999 domain-containing protein [Variovorax boronicumulans]|uniref:DUF3999 domain-containing protein n=1 Tax=Variovorax boronicumulans TaxID=436515 RepID=UPI003397452D
MKRHVTRIVLAAVMAGAGAAQAQPVISAPIALQGPGPYHRLTLPLSIYSRTAYEDLRDLRVRNAAGHAVPYAWLGNEAAMPRTASQAVPFFALPGSATGAATGDPVLAFSVRPDGSLALSGGKAAAERAANDAAEWLIDVSQVKGSLLQARFEIAPEARGLFAFRLEASDDLRRWRPVGGEEQLVRLAHGGQTIERLAVDLGSLRTRFLRLRWTDPQHGAPITKTEIDSVQAVEPVAPLEWSAALRPERCAADYCDYLLPRGLPVQSLRIDLADINTLAQVGVSGLIDAAPASSATAAPHVSRNPLYALRHQQRRTVLPTGPGEVPLLDTVVYRLAQAGGEARSPVLALDGAVYSRLRLRTSGPVSVLGATPPTMAVGAAPRALVFLAQGGAPFSLAWNAAPDTAGTVQGAAPGAPLALATLIPGYAADKPVVADGASVTLPVAAVEAAVAAAALVPVPAPEDLSRQWWLWGALGVGLLLLAGMAWSLFASLRKDRAAE